MKTWMKRFWWSLAILVVSGGLYWFLTRPLPGETVVNQGREHVVDITDFAYNSNPPVSGPHFADWTRTGKYEQELNDGNLIHSLEHGYIIVSHNCELSANCDQLKTDLKSFYDKHSQDRLIVVPRSGMDSAVILTAWNRFLRLADWDQAQAEAFFKAWHNLGPERTME